MPDDLDTTRLAAAKLWLVTTPRPGTTTGDMPYLTHALYALTAVATDDVSSMSADEHWRLYVNPTWLAHTPIPTIGARLAHLVWHLLADHADRASAIGAGRSATWHTATDVTIGDLLTHAKLLDHDLPVAADLGLRPGASAEEHYARLSRLPAEPDDSDRGDGPCGGASDGITRSYELPADADIGHVGRTQAHELRTAVAIAYRGHHGSCGDQPGEWLRHIDELSRPTIPWQTVLAATIRRAAGWANGHADYSYRRRSRRQHAVPRVVLPGMLRPVPRVAVVLDTSASMDDALLAQALGEIDGALAAAGTGHGDRLTAIVCDAAVHTVTRVRDATAIPLAGAGGTDLRHGIAAALQLRPVPELLIVLTDGYTPWPDRPTQPVPTIAALLGRDPSMLPPTPGWVHRVECALP